MTDKNDALFLVRLPFGQKTISYEEVPELIAMAKSPGYDCEKASEHEAVMLALGVCQEEGPLKAAVRAGEVEVLSKSLHRMAPPFTGRLEDTVLTVRALREYVESINGFLEVADAPEPQPTTPSPAPEVSETVEQRRARYLALFEAEERREKRGALQRVADSEKVDRSNMSKDIDKARAARYTQKRAGGGWASQLVQDGKRTG